MSSLRSNRCITRYRWHKHVWFSSWSLGASHSSCLQDYQKVLLSLCTLSQRKGIHTCASILPGNANQVVWIPGFPIMPFAGSLPSPKVHHSFKIRVKIVCADAYHILRALLCTWHKGSGQGFLPKTLRKNKICLTLMQIVQNIVCDKGFNCLAPSHPCHPGLTLSIWYLYCYREPAVPAFKPILLPMHWPHATCQAASLLSAAIWLTSAVSELPKVHSTTGRD